MDAGCYTALVTPFTADGELDSEGLNQLVEFQIEQGITGVLATGTTGESPTFKWEEHNHVVTQVARQSKNKCFSIAGTGSNNTAEALQAVDHAIHAGVDAVLMVDPYYNGPSSMEIRKEYYQPVAKAYPEIDIIPYIIPGRTGAQMLPQDLAILARDFANINSVKEATGNLENMKLTRKCCGEKFNILSGDDALVFEMMTDPEIRSCGVISVMSNIAPGMMTQMISLINDQRTDEAAIIYKALKPLFGLVVVITQEETPFGPVSCRARNPLPVKTLMQILGMPSGPCRRPLGKMTRQGINVVLDAAQQIQKDNPEVFEPVASFFSLDIDARLSDADLISRLSCDY